MTDRLPSLVFIYLSGPQARGPSGESKTVEGVLQLLTQSDRISLGGEDDTIERIGNEEDRQLRLARQFQVLHHLLTDGTIGIDTIDDVLRQTTVERSIKLLGLLGILEEQDHRTAPTVEGVSLLGNVHERMVGRLLADANETDDVVATTRLREQAHLVAIHIKLALGVERTDHLHLVLALAHDERYGRGLSLLDDEELAMRQDATVGQARARGQQIGTRLQGASVLEGVHPAGLSAITTLVVVEERGRAILQTTQGEVVVVERVVQMGSRLIGQHERALMGRDRALGLEIDCRPVAILAIHQGTRDRVALGLDIEAAGDIDEEQQQEIMDYFMEASSDNISEAFDEFEGDYAEEDLRLMRLKLHSKHGN